MADVIFEPVKFNLTTGGVGTTQTITGTKFGGAIPKACIITLSSPDLDDTIDVNARIGIGFFDGTTAVAFGTNSVDARSSDTRASRISRNGRIITTPNSTGTGESFAFQANSLVADGVEIQVVLQSGLAHRCTALLIGGADVAEVDVRRIIMAAGTNSVPIGFEPDLVFLGSHGSNVDIATVNNTIFGVGHNDGTDSQRCTNWAAMPSQVTEKANNYLSSQNIYVEAANDVVQATATIGNYSASGFDLTGAGGSINAELVNLLSIRFTNSPDLKLIDMQYPTSGNYIETGIGFQPSFGMISTLDNPARESENSMRPGQLVVYLSFP